MSRYWVGDGGTWNDTTHWATSSGGASGASVPTTSDDVFFDANSFSSSGQVVLIDDTVATAFCKSMDWTGVLHSPTLRFDSALTGSVLEVHNNFILSAGMNITRTGTAKIRLFGLNLLADFANLIDPKGVSIPIPVNIDDNTFGGFTIDLNSDLITTSFIQIGLTSHNDFTFNTNNHHISCGYLNISDGSKNVSIFAGTSIFDINAAIDTDGVVDAGININSTGSSFTEFSSVINFNYNANNANRDTDLFLNGQSLGEIKLLGTSNPSNPYLFADNTNGTPGSSLRKLTLQPDNNITWAFGGTFTIDTLDANGTSGHTIIFRSNFPTHQYTISSTTVSVSFVDVQDSVAAGSTPFDDSNGGVDSGNNTNWTFTPPNVKALDVSYTTVQGIINVLDCGGQVTGVVYGPAPSPTIADSSITTASIVGPFYVDIPTLIVPGTTTYLRPYTLCSGVYKYYNQIVVTTPAISPILLATDNLIGAFQIEILDGSNNIICNLTGYASNLSYTITRNRPEEISFSIPLLVLQQLATNIFTNINTILNTGINAVRIKYKNQILLAGQMDYWDASFQDPTKPMINIKAHGWLSLLGYRVFTGEYTSHDANYIMRDIITQTQALTNGDFGITLGASATGTNLYADKIFENKSIMDAFVEFSEEADGVDFDFTWDKVFNIYWPASGTQHQDILFTYPGNTLTIDISSDSTKIVNSLLGRGQGNANSNIQTVINDATSQATYKLRTAVKDYPDVSSADQLVNITGSEVQFYKNPLVLHSLTYSPADPSTPDLLDYVVGDSVRVAVSELQLYSDLLNDFFRIDKQTVGVNENGFVTVTLDLNNAPA